MYSSQISLSSVFCSRPYSMFAKLTSVLALAVALASATPLEKRASCACGYVDNNGRVWVSTDRPSCY